MKAVDSRSLMLALRVGLDDERSARRIVEYVIEEAIAGHFGFLKLLLDMVEGKLHQTAEDELTFEAGCVLVMADDGRDAETARAA